MALCLFVKSIFVMKRLCQNHNAHPRCFLWYSRLVFTSTGWKPNGATSPGQAKRHPGFTRVGAVAPWKGKSIKCAFGHFIIHHYSELILGRLGVIRTVYIVNGSHKTCFITYNHVLWMWQNSKLLERLPYIGFINYRCEKHCKLLNISDNAFWKVYILVVSPFIHKFLIVVLQRELSKTLAKQNHTK